MNYVKNQLAAHESSDHRVISTITRTTRPEPQHYVEDGLFLNVLRRRWMLLIVCGVLSGLAGLGVASRFELPKAKTTARLRYVPLPPTLKNVYEAPGAAEMAEMLQSTEYMSELARRRGLEIDPQVLAGLISINAERFSNIIDLEMKWSNPKECIEMVNELVRIARETTTANRKQTLAQYRAETELQYEAVNQSVSSLRDRVTQLRQERNIELNANGSPETEADELKQKIGRVEEQLDELILRKSTVSRQLATLRADVAGSQQQIKQELLRSRRNQLAKRKELYNQTSPRFQRVVELEKELEMFETANEGLDFASWRTKLEALGQDLMGPLEPASISAIGSIERQMEFKQGKVEQMELDLLPMDGEVTTLENRRASLERRLDETIGTNDLSSNALEEADAQLEEAKAARTKLQELLTQIQRGEDTEFQEMTVLTPASWQTTTSSRGKSKLFVFTFAGCFAALVLPVFALEHFFPSGDPAEVASRKLGLPRVGSGTFLLNPLVPGVGHPQPGTTEAIRLLALRIQQSVPGPGALVLFSGLNHEKSAIPTITYLAECLSRREERVLILDATNRFDETAASARGRTSHKAGKAGAARDVSTGRAGTEASHGSDLVATANDEEAPATGVLGLSDYLQRHDLKCEHIICRTSIVGVDMIPNGTSPFPREGMASSSFSALLEQCRQRYTMILVAGPSTNQPSDLQMLSARADGILFTVPSDGRPQGRGDDVVKELLEMGAPVIGIVG